MSEHDDTKALERVTSEMRDERAPDLDWDRLEKQLFARIDADERATRRSGGFRIVAVLAAAAAVLLLLGGLMSSKRDDVARGPLTNAPAARVFGPGASKVDGQALAVGDQLVAGGGALSVDHPGRARWTLDPESQARVTSVGKVISLRLLRGAVSAEVVPSTEPETFVVETEGARVAVHGTKFRVVQSDHGLDVSVSEGVVAVGSRGQKPGFFLHAGDSGKFAKDGSRGEVARASEASREPNAAEHKSNGSPKPALAASPPTAEVDKALDQISAAATRCFANDSAQGEVRVQVRTQLDAAFAADGKLLSVTFEPPLSPTVTECVHRDTNKLRVPKSAQGGVGQRALLLGS